MKQTIAEINKLADGEPIQAVIGKLTKLTTPKKGDDWELQIGEISDETGSYKITFSKCSQSASAIGKTVLITASPTPKGEFAGLVKRSNEEYGDTIWVSSSAAVTFSATPIQETVVEPHAGDSVNCRLLDALSDLQAKCFRLVNEKVKHEITEFAQIEVDDELTPDKLAELCAAAATSLFIQCDRAGIVSACLKEALKYPAKAAAHNPSATKEADLLEDANGEVRGWEDHVIHFGKNKAIRLGDLEPQQLKWYQKEWQPRPFRGRISDQDCALRQALDVSMGKKPTQFPVDEDFEEVPF